MRTVYVIALILISIASCFFVWKTRKEMGLTVYIRRFILGSVIAMISCIVSAYSLNKTLSLVSYGVYFTLKAWLLVFFVQFIFAYTGNRSKAIVLVVTLLACFVTVMAVLNVKFQCAFSVKEIVWTTDGNRYLTKVPGLWHKILLGAGFLSLLLCIVVLIFKMIETPPAYRPRYVVILCMIAVVISFDTAFVLLNTPMDWTALFYSVFAAGAWFFSTRYIRTFLLSGTLAVTVDRLDTGLVVLDSMDEPVYISERGMMLLNADMAAVPGILENWYGTRTLSGIMPQIWEFGFVRNGTNCVYSVRLEQLKDAAGTYNGCFLAINDITAEKERELQEKYSREHDQLTGLYAQDAFLESCEQLMKEKPQEHFLMIRSETEVFDSMRAIYGKDISDAVISALGGAIRRQCYGRGSGGRMNDGGLCMFFPGSGFSQESLVNEVEETLADILGQQSDLFCMRLGICPAEDRCLTAQLLAERAWAAMRFRNNRKNLTAADFTGSESRRGADVSWYTDDVCRQDMLLNNLAVSFDQAIKNRDLLMYLQPVQGGKNNGIIGAEALIRWNRNGEILVPEDFFPQPEQNEMTAALSRFILRQAVALLARWRHEGITDRFVAVNISGKDLYLLDVCSEITGLLKEFGTDASMLRVEISAELVSGEEISLTGIMQKLRNEGVQIILKDFGGYHMAPLLRKNRLFDGIRLDRRLVQDAGTDPACRILAKSITELGRSLGVKVYADGAETEKEYELLKDLKCDGYQGTFISVPVPVEEFISGNF